MQNSFGMTTIGLSLFWGVPVIKNKVIDIYILYSYICVMVLDMLPIDWKSYSDESYSDDMLPIPFIPISSYHHSELRRGWNGPGSLLARVVPAIACQALTLMNGKLSALSRQNSLNFHRYLVFGFWKIPLESFGWFICPFYPKFFTLIHNSGRCFG